MSQIRLLSVGRLDPEKGTIYLLQAMSELVAKGKMEIVLNLVGNGAENQSLQYEVKKRRLEKHVHFLGYVSHGPHLLSIYRQSTVFVLPSLTEGWPQTLFEAMASGVPIVATKVGGIPYLIRDGENGLLVSPASPGEISHAVERLVSDSELRNQLITNGLSTVKKHTLEAERDRAIWRIQEFLKEPKPLR
jgi:glycosyltransferase involved in cell wall biosynthesis